MTSGWAPPKHKSTLQWFRGAKAPRVSFAETPPGCMAVRRHAESEPAGETRDVRRETRGAAVCATYAFCCVGATATHPGRLSARGDPNAPAHTALRGDSGSIRKRREHSGAWATPVNGDHVARTGPSRISKPSCRVELLGRGQHPGRMPLSRKAGYGTGNATVNRQRNRSVEDGKRN